MSIGTTLAQARQHAGLSITEVSERTRIRESLITDIENDDFARCGGDFYSRGHIRSIAHVVGTDPEPLVRDYDAAHGGPPWPVLSSMPEPPAPPPWHPSRGRAPAQPGHGNVPPEGPAAPGGSPPPSARVPGEPSGHPRGGVWSTPSDSTATDPAGGDLPSATTSPLGRPLAPARPPVVPREPEPPAARRPPLKPKPPAEPRPSRMPGFLAGALSQVRPEPSSAAKPADATRPPGNPTRPRPASVWAGQRRRLVWAAVGAAGTVALVAVVSPFLLGSGPSLPAPAPHRSAGATHQASHGHGGPPSGTSQSATPSGSPSGPSQARTLSPASVVAFGPSGGGQGDNPQLARQALRDNPASAWHSDWYTNARFGNLYPGTGLLLDMGRAVSVSSAVVSLNDGHGAVLELRMGTSPTLAGMRPVAHADSSGSTVRLSPPTPVTGRYILVWFTGLPQDSAGTYQASVYDIRVSGHD